MRDIIIIGAGHNGLVAAWYLARAGYKPLVLERRNDVGGAAVTDEFHPGFRCSTLAHSAAAFAPELLRDLDLQRRGLRLIKPDPCLFAPGRDGRSLLLYTDDARSAASIAEWSARDARAYDTFARLVRRFAQYLGSWQATTPPSLDGPSTADLWNLLILVRGLRRLGRTDALTLLRWAPMAVADLAAEWFETPLLRAVLGARGTWGVAAGPRSPGTGLGFLLQAAGDGQPIPSAAIPIGGLGALTQSLTAAALSAGADIRTGTPVARILVKDNAAAGVVLEDGETISASAVVSNADPHRTFLHLVDGGDLNPEFAFRIRKYRTAGQAAKVNLALATLPVFSALASRPEDQQAAALSGRIHIGPDPDYLERAFDASKYGSFSPEPWLDVTIPSLVDDTLAPPGQHVMSIYVQHAPYRLRSGSWESSREALGETVVKTLAAYAPGLDRLVLHRQVITPVDLEAEYALSGGHGSHGEMTLDQLFTMRPLMGFARYRTPIERLYLCGAGTHPGGGVSGRPGANASREIIKDLRKAGVSKLTGREPAATSSTQPAAEPGRVDL